MKYKTPIRSLDPSIRLVGNHFFQTGQTTWQETDAETLESLLASQNPPEFRTILGIRTPWDETKPEEIRYLGPLYFDFDGEDIDSVVPEFKAFLAKLIEHGVSLSACRLYASGNRGFHVEIPMAMFIATVPDNGILALPYIYREMADALFVNTLDLRVYSARKGRMWRVPNRQRTNGKYKVPLTVDEALTITADSYADLVAAPRPFPHLDKAVFSANLALLFSLSRDKVANGRKRKRKASTTETAFKSRFGDNLPPVLIALGQGKFPARGGWNLICLQLATAAHALGITEDSIVISVAGLIRSHQSDGNRYNTPTKREHELRRMYAYIKGTACYELSMGGLRSILPQGLRFNDFRGL